MSTQYRDDNIPEIQSTRTGEKKCPGIQTLIWKSAYCERQTYCGSAAAKRR
jgi:hypothetical protein